MKTILFVVATLFAMGNAFAQLHSKRCDEIKDSLDVPQADGRTAWALKCYPLLRSFTNKETGKFEIIKDGVKYQAYPIFAKLADPADAYGTAIPTPTDPAADCLDPSIYVPIGFCQAGCFTPDQEILMGNPVRYVEIAQASRDLMSHVSTIAGVREDGRLVLGSSPVATYTEDPTEKFQDIITFKTAGNHIVVTPNHPMVDGRGYMVQARTLKVGDSLKNVQNGNEEIIEIQERQYFGKVYNVGLPSQDPLENIIVANDFLTGTVYFQNEGLVELNRLVMREFLPEVLLK